MAFPFVAAFGFVGNIISNWMEKKKIQAEGEVRVTQAKVEGDIKRAQTLVEGDVAIDVAGTEGMEHSWKDEWFTIVLSIPAVMCFINEDMAAHVQAGFRALKETPEWYQYCFIGAIVASFGLSRFIIPLLTGKFSRPQPQVPTEEK